MVHPSPPTPVPVALQDIGAQAARAMYRHMLRIRVVEEAIAELYPEQEMRCPVHLCVGQEAVAVGVCMALAATDYVQSGHRSHGHYLAKGGDLRAMMAELYGKATGCSRGVGGSMHLVDLEAGFLGAAPIVGSTIPIAVGAALGAVMKREDRVAVVFFGDAAVEEGVFHEAVNFAALRRLPVLFVCENNLYSTSSPLSVRQPPGRAIVELGRAHGVESVAGDGNDVLAVHQAAQRAVLKARAGGGPTFLEFATYRWLEHCGPHEDHQLGYRTREEVESWKRRDPVARLEGRLLQAGLMTVDDVAALRGEIKVEMADAVEFARRSPFPSAAALTDHIYAPPGWTPAGGGA